MAAQMVSSGIEGGIHIFVYMALYCRMKPGNSSVSFA
jgi:hypothetical protein